jgi:hypothetical protein
MTYFDKLIMLFYRRILASSSSVSPPIELAIPPLLNGALLINEVDDECAGVIF